MFGPDVNRSFKVYIHLIGEYLSSELQLILLFFQPHVKKCFEGIDHLMFRPDKFGNQDVVGMVSSDGEEVALSNTIYPADAKGMVSLIPSN